ncbi:MAG: threonylcarbamoyl-AMP synthase [Clostridia bacterium]|nr:threonylcarbamoyl-AMP synthase [Clostridia bacterium]
METLIDSGRAAIERGARIIQSGGIVAFPTETVYGLGACAYDAEAISAVFAAKGRPMDNPLIVHLADSKDISDVSAGYDSRYEPLIEKFMPGPLTLVVKKRGDVPDCVTAGLDTVGVRVPSHAVAREFISACGVPIAAPSANLSTKISPTTAYHVFEDMNGRIPLIIDGGDCDVGIESTVLDITGDVPVILRPGAVTAEQIASVLGQVKTHDGKVIAAAPAPGMKYKHYAPSCDCVVASSPDSAMQEYGRRAAAGGNPVILCIREHMGIYAGFDVVDLGSGEDEICRNIYAAMHGAEKRYDCIICEDLGHSGVLASVMNRVNKSAGGKII